MATAIKVENLSKIYRLGEIGTGTISRDIERWVRMNILRQDDPFLRIGERNDRTTKGNSDIVYSLRDINFEIEQGDAVGIIGRNGAGKSTLLKILSRVTAPTKGRITLYGRVASLLEVGTGFHPELSGRENIYLNGAIQGMRRKEIDQRLDEIIDFSGVERYIDTPVKRYSSGMYVRLAFAVAAHLESEILIVDEVLAVGDAEFQKKCLGKMGEVSKGEGRTVLFVSHNMGAVKTLCTKAMHLNNGENSKVDSTDIIIDSYTASSHKKTMTYRYACQKIKGTSKVEIVEFTVLNNNMKIQSDFCMGDTILLNIKLYFNESIRNFEIGINIKNKFGELISHITNFDDALILKGNRNELKCINVTISNANYSPGDYYLDVAVLSDQEHFFATKDLFAFNLTEGPKIKRGRFPSHVKVFTHSNWESFAY